MIMLWLFGVSVVIELLCFFVPAAWRVRKGLAIIAMLISSFLAGAVALWRPNVFSVLIALIGLYRAFNSIRVVQERMHEKYLKRATRRSALVLIALQIVIGLSWAAWHAWHTTGHLSWAVLAAVQLAVAVMLLGSTIRRLKRTAWPAKLTHFSDAELPTISVAIPARNETDDLQACLASLVSSDYPKLEVLVLDDCSQTRRTPEIIREFAHDGVRFIKGAEPKETWLPKNQAYDRLASEANGEYILFCGVDIRFDIGALRQIVGTILERHKKMLSLLPERAPEARSRGALAQAMRYVWELVPPRRLFNRPPVLSSCWIIEKQALQKAGGFVAVTRSIVPEAHFAKELAKTDEYSFMRAGVNPGVSSVKSASEQRATAIRTRYPQVHRRPENVLILSFVEAIFLLTPFVLAIGGYWFNAGSVAVAMATVTIVLLTITYELVALSTHVSTWWFGIVALPLMIGYDIGLLHYSMWQYEFSEVDWKGRNVCVPAMHVIPHLPKI